MSGVISGLLTLFLMIVFLGVVFWAYSKRNKAAFEDMAKLPLAENGSSNPAESKEAHRE